MQFIKIFLKTYSKSVSAVKLFITISFVLSIFNPSLSQAEVITIDVLTREGTKIISREGISLTATVNNTVLPDLGIRIFNPCIEKNCVGLYGGVSYNDAKTDNTTLAFDPTMGFRVGFITQSFFNDKIGMRLGLNFNLRYLTSESSGVETEYKFSFVDVPIFFQYKITNVYSVFLGPSLAIRTTNNTESAGTSGRISDLKTIYPLGTVGVSMDFSNHSSQLPMAVDFYYETGLNSLIRRAPPTTYSNFGVNLILWL